MDRPEHFTDALKLLSLARKYEVTSVRKIVASQLAQDWPSHISAWLLRNALPQRRGLRDVVDIVDGEQSNSGTGILSTSRIVAQAGQEKLTKATQ